MFKNVMVVIFVSVVMAGCSSVEKRSETNELISSAKPNQEALILLPVEYVGDVNPRVKNECSMKESFNNSIERFSRAYDFNLITNGKKSESGIEHKSMLVELDKIKTHVWHWSNFFIFPGSEATVKVSILENGTVIDMTRKKMRTTRSFSSCSRLERIAKVGGKYAVRWAKKKGH